MEQANGRNPTEVSGRGPSGGSEEEIDVAIRSCLGGNPEAFRAIVEAYERPLFNLTFRMTGDREDARDLTQVVLVKAFQNLGKYDSRHRFFSWIYRIAMNESINFVQRSRHAIPTEATAEVPARSPEEEYAGSEVSRQIQAALMDLGPDLRAVLILRHFRGHAYREMSAVLQIPEKTVKSRLFSARRALRQALAARGVL